MRYFSFDVKLLILLIGSVVRNNINTLHLFCQNLRYFKRIPDTYKNRQFGRQLVMDSTIPASEETNILQDEDWWTEWSNNEEQTKVTVWMSIVPVFFFLSFQFSFWILCRLWIKSWKLTSLFFAGRNSFRQLTLSFNSKSNIRNFFGLCR